MILETDLLSAIRGCNDCVAMVISLLLSLKRVFCYSQRMSGLNDVVHDETTQSREMRIFFISE